MSTTIRGFEFLGEKSVTILPHPSAWFNPLHMPGSLSTLHGLYPSLLTVGSQLNTKLVEWSARKKKEHSGFMNRKLAAGLSRFESEFFQKV